MNVIKETLTEKDIDLLEFAAKLKLTPKMKDRNVPMNFLTSRFFRALLSFVLLGVGCIIYIIFRPQSLLMFTCFDKLGITNPINYIRSIGKGYHVLDWVKNCLPNGLWLLSYMLLTDTIWNKENTFSYCFFLWILPIIAICSEILQAFNLVPGVYDPLDLLCYTGAIFMFLSLKFIIYNSL
ncbi:hypothetical protein HMPREF3027_01520 [Porphyromonas sp. HMSC077F02]|nr:hypothetical protein HMPREF3027_01520 [Porphyromonas sp. HMSC077F02]